MDYKELRRLAEAATPGPWAAYDDNEGMEHQFLPLWCVANDEYHNATEEDAQCFHAVIHAGCKEDAELIAALSPSVVLALLEEIEGLRKDATRLVWAMRNMTNENLGAAFAWHVLKVGGTGDLDDCRTFIDADMSPQEKEEGK